MLHPWILAIADDLTGALETGAKFAAQGLTARVTTETLLERRPEVQVLVIDTETRHLSAHDAAALVRDVASCARPFAPWLIYKKTDSTLRGHIAAELRALLKIYPERKVIYVAAYPAMGRTVRDGTLLVSGQPVHLTQFALDPLNPIRQSHIPTLLGDVPAEVIEGDCDADILACARAIVQSETPPLVAGPAAVAEALAQTSPMERGTVPEWPRLPRCVVLNGSLHPVSREQVETARREGCFDDAWELFQPVVLGSGMQRALRTGAILRDRLADLHVDGVVIFGGDTAFGLHHALGALPFDSYGEIFPGVTLSRAGRLYWIAKAGGFGPPSILCDIKRQLT